jgi:integrase/recombinase XerC
MIPGGTFVMCASAQPSVSEASLGEIYRLFAESFPRSLLAENKAPKTVKTYTEDMRLLGELLAGRGMPTELTKRPSGACGVLCWRPARAPEAEHRAESLPSAHRVFGWLIEEGEIKRSSMSNMKPPHVREPPYVLTDDQLRRLLKTCDGRDFAARRDTAIIRLLLDSGMRRSECAGLQLEDVDFELFVTLWWIATTRRCD